jgi:hypothetical protein
LRAQGAAGERMTCDLCVDGFVPFLPSDSPIENAEVTAADLFFAVCLCQQGRAWRVRENCRRKVAPLWVAWCAKQKVSTDRVCMVEDVYSASDLEAAGLTRQPAQLSREAALLANGRAKR